MDAFNIASFEELMEKGGFIMWPLLGISVISCVLILERAWFWLRTNNLSARNHMHRLAKLLREGDAAAVRRITEYDATLYGVVARTLAEQSAVPDIARAGSAAPDPSPLIDISPSTASSQARDADTSHSRAASQLEAVATDTIETLRPRLERFMPTLSTIITVAPMLGILGTVMGLMQSLGVLAEQAGSGDPRAIGTGIAQALLTTAVGMVIAIIVLFPYNAYRAQIDRTLGNLEVLIAAAGQTLDLQATSPDSGSTPVLTRNATRPPDSPGPSKASPPPLSK